MEFELYLCSNFLDDTPFIGKKPPVEDIPLLVKGYIVGSGFGFIESSSLELSKDCSKGLFSCLIFTWSK